MSPFLPWRLAQTARATRRALAGAPVPDGWVGDAVKTQLRLAAGRVQRENGVVRVPVVLAGAIAVTAPNSFL